MRLINRRCYAFTRSLFATNIGGYVIGIILMLLVLIVAIIITAINYYLIENGYLYNINDPLLRERTDIKIYMAILWLYIYIVIIILILIISVPVCVCIENLYNDILSSYVKIRADMSYYDIEHARINEKRNM
jgi:hypothetical protein